MHLARLAAAALLTIAATGAEACPTYSMTGASYSFAGDQLSGPQTLPVTAGGENRLSDCPVPGVGYAATAPDFTFYLSGMERYRLALGVQSACDSTLLVNTADAQWHFDDDSGGNLMPRMELSGSTALNGRVDVWVGTYNRELCAATLTMQTLAAGGGQTQMPPACPSPNALGPVQTATGQQLLSGRSIPVTAPYGGNLRSCGLPYAGYADFYPTVMLDLSGMDGYSLGLDVVASCDTTLLVHGPNGDWLFDDDSRGNLQPMLEMTGPLNGRTRVWVGTYNNDSCAATLTMRTTGSGGSTPQSPGTGSTGGTPQGTGFEPTTTLDRITVLSATYGANCGAPQGNVTSHIAGQCNGRSDCDYSVDFTVIGDPAVGCRKDYTVSYHCGDGVARTAHAGPEAGFGSIVTLQCTAGGSTPQSPGTGSTGGTPQGTGFVPTPTLDRITVLSATYGANCGAPQGNVTGHIAGQCNGQSDCDYRVDYTVIGDPAVGCRKDYTVSYHCGDGVARTAHAGPEAGFGSIVTLQCAAGGP